VASPEKLARNIEISGRNTGAAVIEDGRVVFDMRSARYAVSESHGRWPTATGERERNLVRTCGGAGARPVPGLVTRRMGAAKPQPLELVPTSDRRTPTAREAARRNYRDCWSEWLTRKLYRIEGGWAALGHGLEHSFGPAYVRDVCCAERLTR